MRAISLWQPWATAIALGAKRVETRDWPTNYRGPLAIHAAQRCVKSELDAIRNESCWQGALKPLLHGHDKPLWETLPFGAIVAVCVLGNCQATDEFRLADINQVRTPSGSEADPRAWRERDMGNFSLGRFGWVLMNVAPLSQPLPVKGKQGFFNVPDEQLRPLCPDWKGWAV